MARLMMMVAAVLALSACGSTAGTPTPRIAPPTVEVLSLDADGSAPGRFAALSEKPIDLRAFAGWYGGATEAPEPVPAKPGTTFLAVTDSTGCRAPESVEVRRAGDDLVVTFTGGVDHEECFRAVGPTALLALRTSEVRGVRTVNGAAPLDPAGPGALAHFVPLGTGDFDGIAPAELGATDEMAARLGDSAAVLAEPVPAGRRGFAFVLSGCAETGALLLVSHAKLTAALTGGEHTNCDAPAYFLAIFTIAADDVPPSAAIE